jgi:hypothetical protein
MLELIGGRLIQTLVIAVAKSAVFQTEIYNNNTPEKMCEFWVHASSKSECWSKIGMWVKMVKNRNVGKGAQKSECRCGKKSECR